jgi:hypothetical protein
LFSKSSARKESKCKENEGKIGGREGEGGWYSQNLPTGKLSKIKTSIKEVEQCISESLKKYTQNKVVSTGYNCLAIQ